MARSKKEDEPQYKEVTIPAGGLSELAANLWPDDILDIDKFRAHVRELWVLNHDILRTIESHTVGQKVKVPV